MVYFKQIKSYGARLACYMLVCHLGCFVSLDRYKDSEEEMRMAFSWGASCQSRTAQVGQEDDACVGLAGAGTLPPTAVTPEHSPTGQIRGRGDGRPVVRPS